MRRMLRLRSIGKKCPTFLGLVGLGLLALVRAPVANQEKSQHASGNQPGEKCVHLLAKSHAHEPEPHHDGNVNDSKNSKRIAERPMDYVPKMKDASAFGRGRPRAWKVRLFASRGEPPFRPPHSRLRAARQTC